MWLRNCWQVAGFSKEIGRSLLARRLLNEPVVFFRTENGAVVALEDRCPHRYVPLSIGELQGDRIRCGYHGMEFDPSGQCVKVPGQSVAPKAACAKTYPVVERHDLVWIWLGEAELADPALVPDIHWFADPNWAVSDGYHRIEADYRLVTDNLLDLSHETYVHKETIGNGAVADSPVHVTVEHEYLVRAHREMLDIDPPPFFARMMGYEGKIDRLQTAVYMPPGINMTIASVLPAGGDRDKAYTGRAMHLLTPETEHSTHYFWGFVRNYRLEDSEMTDFIREALRHTFDQDKVLLELQSKALRELPEARVPGVAIRVDGAPIQARRLLGALIEKERAESRVVAPPVPLAATA